MEVAKTSNVWILPMPFFSHVVCFAQLAGQIARYGPTVTLFATQSDIDRLHSSDPNRMLENWRLQGLKVHFRNLEIEHAVLGGMDSARLARPFNQAVEAFMEILKAEAQGPPKPTCAIVDFWIARPITEVATQHGVPIWLFIIASPSFLACNFYATQLQSKGILTLPDSDSDQHRDSLEEVISVPGMPLIKMYEMGLSFRDHPLYSLYRQGMDGLTIADHGVILFSGFQEMEPRALPEFKKLLKAFVVKDSKKTSQLVLTVGPTFHHWLHSNESDSEANGTADEEVHPCIKFLDSQSPSSVIYAAFGSDVNLSLEQIQELAFALEGSQRPFLCVLHPPKVSPNSISQVDDRFPASLALPGSKGMFVRWAPQLAVLSHPSMGCFISHCGQNSVLESAFMGVPILAWPFQYDQLLNCRFLVDEARIAVEVCPGLRRSEFVDRKYVEKAINTLFDSEEGTAVRKRVFEMKLLAESSVAENGSSSKNMQTVIALIESLANTA